MQRPQGLIHHLRFIPYRLNRFPHCPRPEFPLFHLSGRTLSEHLDLCVGVRVVSEEVDCPKVEGRQDVDPQAGGHVKKGQADVQLTVSGRYQL